MADITLDELADILYAELYAADDADTVRALTVFAFRLSLTRPGNTVQFLNRALTGED